MPELPEVETVLRSLKPVLEGRRIVELRVLSPKLRVPIPRKKIEALIGHRISSGTRRAKYMIWNFENGQALISHLGMSGVFRLRPSEEAQSSGYAPEKHEHIWLRLDDGTELVYRDPRRFGVLDVVDSDDLSECSYLKALGPEPLDKNFSAALLHHALNGKKQAIKQAIMDQCIVVGVGNIYASEALYEARIHPERDAGSLTLGECTALVRAIKAILKSAIADGGSTLRDYRQIGGERGYFQTKFNVYDREGEFCPDKSCSCRKKGGIKRLVQGGRSTFFCPGKQVLTVGKRGKNIKNGEK